MPALLLPPLRLLWWCFHLDFTAWHFAICEPRLFLSLSSLLITSSEAPLSDFTIPSQTLQTLRDPDFSSWPQGLSLTGPISLLQPWGPCMPLTCYTLVSHPPTQKVMETEASGADHWGQIGKSLEYPTKEFAFFRGCKACFSCFQFQATTLRIFRFWNTCDLEKGLQSLRGPFGEKNHTVWLLYLNKHWCWFRALFPVIAYLQKYAMLEQKLHLFSPCGFWKWIFTLTQYTFFNLEKYITLLFSGRSWNHLSFNVRDGRGQVSCWMWKGNQSPITFSSGKVESSACCPRG